MCVRSARVSSLPKVHFTSNSSLVGTKNSSPNLKDSAAHPRVLSGEMAQRGFLSFGPNGAPRTITNDIRIYCLPQPRT